MNYSELIKKEYDEQCKFQIGKNIGYSNFYFEPINIFSRIPAKERILSRLDEKLGRVNHKGLDKELARDIIGCLVSWLVLDTLEKENKGTPKCKEKNVTSWLTQPITITKAGLLYKMTQLLTLFGAGLLAAHLLM